MRTQRLLNAGLFTVLAGIMVACGNPIAKVREAADRTQYMNDMKQIGIAMLNFHDVNRRMPKNANELIAANPDLQGSAAASRLMSGEITMVWDFKLVDQNEVGTFQTLMGWSNSPVFKGDIGAIYCDGSVRIITSAEFSNAKQATLKSAEPVPVTTPPTRPAKKSVKAKE
jgi:hypothetical protein